MGGRSGGKEINVIVVVVVMLMRTADLVEGDNYNSETDPSPAVPGPQSSVVGRCGTVPCSWSVSQVSQRFFQLLCTSLG